VLSAVEGLRQLVQHHVRRTREPDAPDRLTAAAAQYGIGPDYTIEGLTTVTGSVPPTVNLAELTEDGFGQGKVVVDPVRDGVGCRHRRGRQDYRHPG
jgi:hypothetical protein